MGYGWLPDPPCLRTFIDILIIFAYLIDSNEIFLNGIQLLELFRCGDMYLVTRLTIEPMRKCDYKSYEKASDGIVSAKVFWVLQTEQTSLLDNRPHVEQLFSSI